MEEAVGRISREEALRVIGSPEIWAKYLAARSGERERTGKSRYWAFRLPTTTAYTDLSNFLHALDGNDPAAHYEYRRFLQHQLLKD
jgi:hypothetical protein